MKRLLIFISALLLLTEGLYSQTFPETFNYQAVARNDDGSVVANTAIVVEVTIIQGDDCANGGTCSTIWQELHYPTTSDFGLFSINIGEGQTTFAGSATDFAIIDWNDFTLGSYYLQLRVDFGVSGYVNGLIDVGTVKLQSVPYAFSSENAQDLVRQGGKVPINLTELLDVDASTISVNEVLAWNGTGWMNANVSSGGPISLNDLTDVTVTGSLSNQLLVFNGSNWVNSDYYISQLSDVFLTSSTSGQALTYNGTNWVNSTLTIANISDFNFSTLTIGEAIIWNGTNWVNQTPGGGSSVWTDDGTYLFYNGGNNVGIGTSTPVTGFQYVTTANDGFVVNGTFNSSGSVYDLGAGSRMSFFPSKGAFRAGTVDGTQWNDALTGDYSAAFGFNSTASGNYSLVAGRLNTALGAYGVAFGYDNEAQGVASLVLGTGNLSIGLNSLVLGTNNNQSAGLDADNSIVGGTGNDAYTTDCIVIGTNNDAYGQNSIVFGNASKTDATGIGAMAGGSGTNARGNYSVAFGLETTAGALSSMVLGQYNSIGAYSATVWNATDAIFIVGNGTGPTSRNNALLIRKNGDVLTETGVYATAVNPTKGQKIANFADILNLEGIYFDDGKAISYGLNSNQVETYFPSLITIFNNDKAINYSGFVPLMIETIKQQQIKINDLQTENETLKQQLQNIEERLLILENK
ncbi:MAG: hypothetical protein JXR68_00935 [Bacteroidales bacterium]|nr:hypothetical protein [Bacteroidales bacterium]